MEVEGLDSGGTTPEAQAGLLINGGLFLLDNGTAYQFSETGSASIQPNGQVVFSQLICYCSLPLVPVPYLVSQGEGFVVATNQSEGTWTVPTNGNVDFGKIVPQSAYSFTNASLKGNFMGGSEQPVSATVGEEIDSVNFDGIGTITGTADQNGLDSNGAYSPSSGPINGTYAVSSNGRVVVTNGEQQTIIYIISSSEFVALTTGFGNKSYSNSPYLIDFKQ